MATKIKIAGRLSKVNKPCRTKNKEFITENMDTALDILRLKYPNRINFSIKETAQIVNVSYDFIRERINDGTIKSVRYGDRLMIGISELIRIINEGV